MNASAIPIFVKSFCILFTLVSLGNDLVAATIMPDFGLSPLPKYAGCLLLSVILTYYTSRPNEKITG